jgi:hypothetical protein
MMRSEAIVLLVSSICLACGIPLLEAALAQETNTVSRSDNFKILVWPDNKAPDGFMTGLQLVSLPPELSKAIVANAKPTNPNPGKAPQAEPVVKTPLAAAEYFNEHLNMGGPPKYMAVHTEANGAKCYLFSGGLHWGKQPLFSKAAVLLETGEIRYYNAQGNEAPADTARKP